MTFRAPAIFFIPLFLLHLGAVPLCRADMVLLGTATKRFLTFPVVTASLYVEEGYGGADVLTDIPKRIDVNYHLNVSRRDLGKATTTGIRKNSGRVAFKNLAPRIKRMNAFYPDVRAGDRISVMYIPGHGSEVWVNGQLRGVVPGGDFALAFFSIWVGPHPVDSRARVKLLGSS